MSKFCSDVNIEKDVSATLSPRCHSLAFWGWTMHNLEPRLTKTVPYRGFALKAVQSREAYEVSVEQHGLPVDVAMC